MDHKAAQSASNKDQNSNCDSSSVCSSEAEQDLMPEEQHYHEHSPAARSYSPQKQREQAAAVGESPDEPYNSYRMSAVNKLVSELARKQSECRKAKLHAVVRLASPRARVEATAHSAKHLIPRRMCLIFMPTVYSPPISGTV